MIIDNWLYDHSINHAKEVPYPVGKFVADWRIEDGTLVKYFGLAYGSRRYDKKRRKKIRLCKALGGEANRDLCQRLISQK